MRRAAVIAIALTMAACGGGSHPAHTTTTAAAPGPAPVAARLADSHRCPRATGFTCSTLSVPLDHSGHTPGELRLAVAAGDNAGAARGVLVVLTGGPGQGGVDFVPRVRARLRPLLRSYRLVMFDQRGTGRDG